MIEYKVSKSPNILFVGINPHPGSFRRGVPFSNNKMFWYLLNRAGLIQEKMDDLKDDQQLKRIYDEKFIDSYNLNFLNLVDRPTVDVTQLHKGEERDGVQRVLETVPISRPKVICFIGKIALHTFYGIRKSDWGWQPDIEGIKTYLMHFPLRGLAEIRVKEFQEIVGHARSIEKAYR